MSRPQQHNRSQVHIRTYIWNMPILVWDCRGMTNLAFQDWPYNCTSLFQVQSRQISFQMYVSKYNCMRDFTILWQDLMNEKTGLIKIAGNLISKDRMSENLPVFHVGIATSSALCRSWLKFWQEYLISWCTIFRKQIKFLKSQKAASRDFASGIQGLKGDSKKAVTFLSKDALDRNCMATNYRVMVY